MAQNQEKNKVPECSPDVTTVGERDLVRSMNSSKNRNNRIVLALGITIILLIVTFHANAEPRRHFMCSDKTIIEPDPKTSNDFMRCGYTYMLHGSGLAQRPFGLSNDPQSDFKHAINDLTQAIQIDPTEPNLRSLLSECYSRMGNHSQAAKQVAMALKMNSKCSSAYNSLGMDSFRLRKYDKAIKEYTIAIECALLGASPNKCALGMYTNFVKDGDLSYYYYNRGRAFVAKNDFGQAAKDFDRILALNNRTLHYSYLEDVYYYLAICHEKRKPDQSIANYNKFLDLSSEEIAVPAGYGMFPPWTKIEPENHLQEKAKQALSSLKTAQNQLLIPVTDKDTIRQ